MSRLVGDNMRNYGAFKKVYRAVCPSIPPIYNDARIRKMMDSTIIALGKAAKAEEKELNAWASKMGIW